MARNRLRQRDIQMGSPLPWDTFDAEGRLLLCQGSVVDNEEQLERLIRRGLFIDVPSPDDPASAGIAQPPAERERIAIFEMLDQVRTALQALLQRPVAANFSEDIVGLADRLQSACEIDADAALASAMLFRTQPYSIRQQCNTAVISEMMCRQLDWTRERRVPVVAAALTMNISMLKLQDGLYHQGTPLDDVQRAAIREHPAQSVAQLQQLGVSDLDWLNAIAQHHEALDGSGYPAALKGDDIVTQARIIAIADKYCAIIAERGSREGAPADVAVRRMLVAHGTGLDTQLIARLIREVGIFPPGTPVELNNKEIGIVVRRTLDPRHPVIRAVISAQGSSLRGFPERLTSTPAFTVRSAVDRDRLGPEFDPIPLWSPDASE